MNTQNNKKLNKNLNESIEKTFKTIDEYINNIQQAELPEDIKKEILNVFHKAREELNSDIGKNIIKTEEE
ncbi:hypothetical protein N9U61_04145 [Acidimicrobiaceae bacterium]|nr:hypothetical protein [Acidimicrobiaceae bacterium]|tara:strand:+ start:223 stop:432 length:210 start_codon:yes stop_codon:yes gene_type:complete